MSRLRIGAFATLLVKKPCLFSNLRRSDYLTSTRTFTVSNITNMKFVQFTYKNKPNEIRVGYLDQCPCDNVVDINKCNPEIPSTMLGILQEDCLPKVQSLKSDQPVGEPFSNVCLMAPITGMDKVLCVGLNYADHCIEQNLAVPEVPMIFSKFSSTIIGPSEAVRLRTDVTQQVDYEVELAFVIGKRCCNVKAADAYDYVFGYTVAQDISSRDWQKERNGGQFLLGKAQDTFCPIGPWIVPAESIPDPLNLNITCAINGETMQASNTCNIIHKIPDVIERLSAVMTLLPGDIVLTGTPGGVGCHRKPPLFLKPGDLIRSEIESIGCFEVKVQQF